MHIFNNRKIFWGSFFSCLYFYKSDNIEKRISKIIWKRFIRLYRLENFAIYHLISFCGKPAGVPDSNFDLRA